jgi:hypothetical protein
MLFHHDDKALVAPAAANCLFSRARRRFRGTFFPAAVRIGRRWSGLAVGSREQVGSVPWRSCWPQAMWRRGWPAAPVGPDLGPFGPHLGRGRQAGLRVATKLPGGGEVRWQTGGGGIKAGLLQRGGGVFVGLFGPGRASAGLV